MEDKLMTEAEWKEHCEKSMERWLEAVSTTLAEERLKQPFYG